MKIRQFRYAKDNFAYLVYGKNTAVAIDPGAVDHILDFADQRNITITQVTNTHFHYDHVQGNDEILKRTRADFMDCRMVQRPFVIDVDQERLTVFPTPGHTKECVTFKAGDTIITGDTLFNGTVGTCFSGDMKSFLHSINTLMALSSHTRIYSGHDYVAESIAFAKTIDRENPHFDDYVAKINPQDIFSTIEDEFKVNPFVRYNDDALIKILKEKNLPVQTEYDRWTSVFELY